MSAISKQSGERGTSSKQNEFRRATWWLTLYYTAGIVCILVVTSAAIMFLFQPQRSVPASPIVDDVDMEESAGIFELPNIHEVREHLPSILLVVDLGVLMAASIGAYFFATYTLRPVEEAYVRRERFVSDVAHELRTPLAVLRSGAESILHRPRDPTEYAAFISESLEEVDRMTRLSNDLLDLVVHTRAPARAVTRVDLADIVRRQIQQFTPYAAQASVTIRAHTDVAVHVASFEDDLVRLVQNLIKNAIDYNRPDGTVDVTVSMHNDMAELTVADTGIGIDAANLAHIEEPFYKVDTSRQQTTSSGTGLGLSIVRGIVSAHSGTLAIASTPGEGTVVRVTLPESA